MYGKLVLAGLVLSVILASGCVLQTSSVSEVCVKSGTGERMTLQEAMQIATAAGSECAKTGALKETHMCNQITGTWWIDLAVEKQGCAPACVVDVVAKKAEVNWRCTGLLPPA